MNKKQVSIEIDTEIELEDDISIDPYNPGFNEETLQAIKDIKERKNLTKMSLEEFRKLLYI